MIRLGVLISGRGSNLGAILKAIGNDRLKARVVTVASDRPAAGLTTAKQDGIPSTWFNRKQLGQEEFEELLVAHLQDFEVDFVVLAGFMRLLSSKFLAEFPDRVVNIHPSLLPAFPGVDAQKQALEYGVKVSGCTVHFVDEGMDTGPIIAQAAVPVHPDDDEESLKTRILKAEHLLYPHALNLLATGKVSRLGRIVHVEER